jgi:hypothetical protein
LEEIFLGPEIDKVEGQLEQLRGRLEFVTHLDLLAREAGVRRYFQSVGITTEGASTLKLSTTA